MVSFLFSWSLWILIESVAQSHSAFVTYLSLSSQITKSTQDHIKSHQIPVNHQSEGQGCETVVFLKEERGFVRKYKTKKPETV